MANNTHTLTSEHQWFIDENRHDPVTHKTFNIGERVVVCANCKKVFKATTWDEVGNCIECKHSITQRQFLTKPEQREPLSIGGRRGRQQSRTNRTGIVLGDRQSSGRNSASQITPPPRTTNNRPLPSRTASTTNRRIESERRLRERKHKNLRKVFYYVIIGLLIITLGISYTISWIFTVNEDSEAAGVLLILAGSALFFILPSVIIYWKNKADIEDDWSSFASGFFKCLSSIVGIYVAMFLLSWLILVLINAVTS